jgi:hypothetical protein
MASKLKSLPNMLLRGYVAKTNVFMRGKPGIGKTDTIVHFIDKMRERVPEFQLWNFYGPTMSPTDIQMAMPEIESGTLRVFNNGTLPNAYSHPEAKGVVFIGEMPNTDPTTLKLLQKYINGEDMNGTLRKPKGVMVIADGNRIEDKAGVMQHGRALLNRFMTIDVYTDVEDNIEYAAKHSWHPFVQSMMREHPDVIDNYDRVFLTSDTERKRAEEARRKGDGRADTLAEEGKNGVWACMRGWNRVSELEFAAEGLNDGVTMDEIAGSVGVAVGALYLAHKSMIGRLASLEEVLNNPEGVAVPTKIDELYAMCQVLSLRVKEEHLPKLHAFAKRIQYDMQAFMLRTMMMRKNFKLLGTDVYRAWILDPQLNKLLNVR